MDYYTCWIYLVLMVDICLCCNQAFHYQNVPLHTGSEKGCPSVLEVTNILVIISTQQNTHTWCYTYHEESKGTCGYKTVDKPTSNSEKFLHAHHYLKQSSHSSTKKVKQFTYYESMLCVILMAIIKLLIP